MHSVAKGVLRSCFLMEMRNFGHMLGRMNQLKRDPLAMTTRGEPPPFYHRDLVWHLSVNGIMGNTVHARL